MDNKVDKSCDNCKFEEYSWKEQVCVSCERHGMVQYKDNWQPKPTDKDQTKAEDNKVKLKRRETCMYCGQKITAGQEDAIEEVIPGIIKQVDTALVNKDKQIEQLQAEIKLEQSNAKEAEKCATRLIDKLDKAVERIDKEIEKHINSSIEYRRTGLNESAVTHKVLQQGLQKAKDLKPDLIILDIIMPKMAGNEVAAVLKGDQRYANIPIIFLTCLAEGLSDKQGGEEIAGNLFIAKPFEADKLLLMINNIFKKQSSKG